MAQPIPQFGLYGEGRWIDNPEFVHIENIEARSSDLGWRIKPHQHTQLLQILLLRSGGVHLQMDTQRRALQGKWAIIVPAGIVHGFRFAPDTDGRVLSISDALIAPSGNRSLQTALLPSHPGYIDFQALPSAFDQLWQLTTLLEHEFHNANTGKALLIEHLLNAILILIARHHKHPEETPNSHDDSLINRLKVLVNTHFKEHLKTTDYAQKLNVSDKKLNRLTQQSFGKSVQQLMHERLLLEAKRNLTYTQKSVEEISYDLGFKDPGYFSRFFKRQEKITPGKFRKLADNKEV
ncbi:AraC family transcriptional regulator [Marinomonas piezotolerans]|uniref:AraC family transcriptional regulator n=1 Tax=Marinomonas piezotolerans TaxID=2213058 RepID=A0A370U6A9_9GAMM|nr:helix-turn-helix domain-containing protein [Marinomonas piezotolerans]RDL43316.1 AraC family transcriptional regulator [Marinomonas piezotolerans]